MHSDLNSFYASVECQYNPKIRNCPVAVCGDPALRHGIVLAANRIAKKYGIKTGMVIFEAKKLCPNLITITANFDLYLWFSEMQREIYSDYTDRIEAYGIDECWLDVSASARIFGDGKKIADEIRARTKVELGITASIGVSYNKIYAKLGSDMKKPDATTVITRENREGVVFPQPVEDLLYVGRKTKPKLNKMGIFTIGELANFDLNRLTGKLGKWGMYLWSFANGYDLSEVLPENSTNPVKSVGNSQTAMRDLHNYADVLMLTTIMSESVAARLFEQGLKGQVISLYLRDNTLASWGRQRKIEKPTFLSNEIISEAMKLFNYHYFNNPIRSVGVNVSMLTPADAPVQYSFFDNEQERMRAEMLERAIYDIRMKHGHHSIKRAVLTLDNELTNFNPKEENTIHPYSYF